MDRRLNRGNARKTQALLRISSMHLRDCERVLSQRPCFISTEHADTAEILDSGEALHDHFLLSKAKRSARKRHRRNHWQCLWDNRHSKGKRENEKLGDIRLTTPEKDVGNEDKKECSGNEA